MEVYVMTLVRRPSPFGELMTLRRAMDRIFDEDLFRSAAVENGQTADHVTEGTVRSDATGQGSGTGA